MKSEFDYATGHHHYAGNVVDVTKSLDKDLGDAEKKWRPLLEHVATEYGSFEWAAAATARIGTLYDSIRTGLDLVAPNYFTPQQDALLKKLQTIADKLNDAGQGDKADQVQKSIDDTKDAGPQQVARDQGPVPRGLQPEDGRQVRHRRAHRAQVQREGRGGAERRRRASRSSRTTSATTR